MKFLEDDKGNKSSMRLMSVIALFAAIWFGHITISLNSEPNQTGLFITFGFLLAAFAPKTLQKMIEMKVL